MGHVNCLRNAQLSGLLQYAQWEEGQKDFRRARSVWERALDVSYTNPTTWLKYAEMEMRHRFINHARNVWDRAVSLLPRVDQLWYAQLLSPLLMAISQVSVEMDLPFAGVVISTQSSLGSLKCQALEYCSEDA